MDIKDQSNATLKHNTKFWTDRLMNPRTSGEQRIRAREELEAIKNEIARRKETIRATASYVLTATGDLQHIASSKIEGKTRCGQDIDLSRQYGDREWFHCLNCERGTLQGAKK